MLSGGAALLGLLALVLVAQSYDYRDGIERGQQRDRVLMIAGELQDRVKTGQDARIYTVHVLIGAGEGSKLAPVGDFTLKVAGTNPKYEGTTVMYAVDDKPVITLTVSDLTAGEWTVEEVPMPSWWEFWKK